MEIQFYLKMLKYQNQNVNQIILNNKIKCFNNKMKNIRMKYKNQKKNFIKFIVIKKLKKMKKKNSLKNLNN